MELFPCRVRRRMTRGLKRKPMALIKRLRKAKKEAPALEKPEVWGLSYNKLKRKSLSPIVVITAL